MAKKVSQPNNTGQEQAGEAEPAPSEKRAPHINWVEILVVGIILATLGWLAVTVFNMNGTLAKVEAQGDATKEDLSSIKGVLPELGKTIAQFEVKSPVEAAFVASKPFNDESGKLVKTINVIDTKEKMVLTYTLPLKNESDSEKTLLLNGIIFSQSARPVSFMKLENYSNVIGMNYTLSPSVDINNSFLVSNLNAAQYKGALDSYFGQPKVSALEVSAHNWILLNQNFDKLPIKIEKKERRTEAKD